jgi:hypothetical protein
MPVMTAAIDHATVHARTAVLMDRTCIDLKSAIPQSRNQSRNQTGNPQSSNRRSSILDPQSSILNPQ